MPNHNAGAFPPPDYEPSPGELASHDQTDAAARDLGPDDVHPDDVEGLARADDPEYVDAQLGKLILRRLEEEY